MTSYVKDVAFGPDPSATQPEEPSGKGHRPTQVILDETHWFNQAHPDLADQIATWWYGKANTEIDMVVPKAIEYGATDLIDIGLMLARTMRRTVTEEEAAELGVFFYLIGKIARWQSAIERGERPSDDTLLDIGVYVRMAQRIRDTGGWPTGPKGDTDAVL